jgi:glycosyltransferase involved in cell wall biosynthesis
MAGPRVTFLTKVSDSDMAHYFQRAEAFIFPGVDDFGIVAVEALAACTPVIAYKDGGALDYVKENKTGLFFEEQSVESLIKLLDKYEISKFNHVAFRKSAAQFSDQSFVANIQT